MNIKDFRSQRFLLHINKTFLTKPKRVHSPQTPILTPRACTKMLAVSSLFSFTFINGQATDTLLQASFSSKFAQFM